MSSSSEEIILQYELSEARAEIKRHHEDFERIRAKLDECEPIADEPNWSLQTLIKDIRNIVG